MNPNQFEVLQNAFWSGEISEREFKRKAAEANATPEQISDFLTEVREHDGVM